MTYHLRALIVLLLAAASSRAAELPQSLDLETIRAIPVQHEGRWPPLDTVARDIVESVTGDIFYQGHDPVLLLLAWTFDTPTWQRAPLIRLANAELRAELKLPATQTEYSYADLTAQRHLHKLVDELKRVEGRKLNPLEAKVSDLEKKLIQLQDVYSGRAIRAIPNPDEAGGLWRPIGSPRATGEGIERVRLAWAGLRAAFLADDAAAFAAASQQLATTLGTLPAATRPTAELITTELRYNRQRPFRTAWQIMVVGAVLAAAALRVRRRVFDAVAVAVMVAGFAVLTYGLSLRWQIAGRIPAANMFESLLFLSWGMGAFAVVAMFVQRNRIVPLTASAMGALALILADVLPMDHFVRPIAPVLLDTVWMSIHVPIIMVSYSVLALGVLIAHVQLVAMAAVPHRRTLISNIDALHYWYIHVGSILLIAGIITGSMWAASSWGRYWGWDPKEVWALIAFLGYTAILHVRIDHERVTAWMYAVAALLAIAVFVVILPKMAPFTLVKAGAFGATAVVMALFVLARGTLGTALKSILAFWLIIMTYVGVNFVLGIGLHSYGFGTGAVVNYLFVVGVCDLALVAVCCVICLVRRGGVPGPAPGLPATASA